MENAVLKALISGWPAELSAAKAKYLKTKTTPQRLLMTRQDYVQLILQSFREGHGSSCLDFALENIKVVSDLFKLSKQTSITDTKGIVVQVTTIFSPRDNRMSSRELVDPKVGFVYYYRISIENHSKETVQLLGRHWRFKAKGFEDMVVPRWAQGVIGEQPVISPGDGFSYMSSAAIHNPSGGAMEGAFEMLNCNSKKRFEVKVGETAMIPSQF